MKVSRRHQLEYASVALRLAEAEESNVASLRILIDVGELLKKYAADDNSVIFDLTEYLYEQLRLKNGEPGAFDDPEMRAALDREICMYLHDLASCTKDHGVRQFDHCG